MCMFVFWMQVMKAMCKQGYKDALHFLKKNGEKLWLSFVRAVSVNKPVTVIIYTFNTCSSLQATCTFLYLGSSVTLPCFSLFWLSDLLNFNGPYRGRQLLGDGGESQDHNVDEEDDKHDEEEAVMVHCSSCIEEHLVEHLSPTLHKGIYGTKQQI